MQLDDKIQEIQKQLSLIEAYKKLAEWLNATIPSNKDLNKFVTSSDTLVTVAQELSQFATLKAEALASNVDVVTQIFTKEEIGLIKQLVQHFRSKIAPQILA